MLLMSERPLPGAKEIWWQTWEGAGEKHGMCWGWSAEKGEKLETKIAAVLGEWSVSTARIEQRCAQEIASISNGSSFLTSLAMKYYVWLYKQGDFMIFARRDC